MTRAIQLARRGLYTTHPNPRVGCVLVKDGAIIAEGWHEVAGGPHAEIMALDKACSEAKGATCYVSLEPCNHQGRTGPCSEALIAAGVARVIAAMPDPNPQVAGQGLARLEAAGLSTGLGLMQDAARQLNTGYIMRMEKGRPRVRCKMAMSLDGRTAMADGQSQWISGGASRADVQRLRAMSAGIMTGIGTVLADDPSLTVREVEMGDRQPLRIVLDRRLRCPATAKMLSLPGRTLVYTEEDGGDSVVALNDAGAEVVPIDAADFLTGVMQHLVAEELNEVLLEAGPTLAGAMLEQRLVDEIILYQAPVLLGDAARGLFTLPGIKSMQDRITLALVDERMIGEDRRLTYRIEN